MANFQRRTSSDATVYYREEDSDACFLYHGGGCCGIAHLSGMYANEPTLDAAIKGALERKGRMLLEVVVTGQQIRLRPYMADLLKKHKFVLVSSFINPNSGNTCYVFHHRKSEGIPDWWKGKHGMGRRKVKS